MATAARLLLLSLLLTAWTPVNAAPRDSGDLARALELLNATLAGQVASIHEFPDPQSPLIRCEQVSLVAGTWLLTATYSGQYDAGSASAAPVVIEYAIPLDRFTPDQVIPVRTEFELEDETQELTIVRLETHTFPIIERVERREDELLATGVLVSTASFAFVEHATALAFTDQLRHLIESAQADASMPSWMPQPGIEG